MAYYSNELIPWYELYFLERKQLGVGCMKRILGKINPDIINKWELYEHRNKMIVMYEEAEEHSKSKHLNDFPSEKDYNDVMDSLKEIIRKPDYVFYDKSKKGLEYYKKVNSDVLVAVRVDDGSELKVKSVYPVKQEKIENRKKKEKKTKLYNKYVKGIE